MRLVRGVNRGTHRDQKSKPDGCRGRDKVRPNNGKMQTVAQGRVQGPLKAPSKAIFHVSFGFFRIHMGP